MKASEKAKEKGLKSLSQVSEMTGQSLQTLINWSEYKPKLFDIVLTGCLEKINQNNLTDNQINISLNLADSSIEDTFRSIFSEKIADDVIRKIKKG